MIGNILLTIGFLAGIFSVLMYFFTVRGYQNTKNLARISYHVMAITVIASAALLLYAILTHQYQYEYVYSYSGSGLPTGLLVSTFYAGQQGSFMLWLFFTSIVGLILLEYTSKRGDLEERVMMIFTLVASFLLLMVNPLLKSPFNYIWSDPTFLDAKNINQAFLGLPFIQNFLFSDPNSGSTFVKMNKELYGLLQSNGISIHDFIIQGKGLNPLLQNFWMQIHPPMLFLGFSMAAVPFSFAMAALIKNEYRDWIKQSLPWILTGMMVLGLAIMLGGYWAYGVLGWGGYWGWDPVENSSLVPWIFGVALIHTMLVQKKSQNGDEKGRFVKTNLILAVLTFVLVLYSTFLTRSGILGDSSVHSFVSPGMLVYFFLILFVGFFTLMGVGGIAFRWKYLNEKFNDESNGLSRELALFTGSVTLIASAVIILVGTSAPIFGQSVETRFYNELNLPIGIIIGLLNGLSLLLKWKYTKGKDLIKSSKYSLIASVVLTALIVIFGRIHNVMLAIFSFAAAFALFVNLEIAVRIIRGRKTYLGAYIAHIGIALFMLGVIATGGYTNDHQIDLVKGKTTHVMGYDLTFIGLTPFDNGQKYKFNIEVSKDGNISHVAPVMYIASFNNSLMREPDILNMFTRDLYISPLGYDEGKNSNGGQKVSIQKGYSEDYEGAKITFNSFDFPKDAMNSMMNGGDFELGANLIVDYNGQQFKIEPKMKRENGQQIFVPAEIPEANMKIQLASLNAAGKVDLQIAKLDGNITQVSAPQEVLSVEASIKPFINLVWAGVLIMVLGFIVSTVRRTKESQA